MHLQQFIKQRTVWLILASIFFLQLFIFRDLVTNLTTHLVDAHDYPFYVWTVNQQIENMAQLRFGQFFESNIFYPNTKTLLFSDLLLPQSLIGVPISFFTDNPILIFNVVFFTTLFLNSLAAVWLATRVSQDSLVRFFISLVTAVSPFVFLQLGHFQMISFWPLLLTLAALTFDKPSLKQAFFIGIGIVVQFLASVYLAIFLTWIVGLWYLFEIGTAIRQSKTWNKWLLHLGVMIGTTLVLGGFFFWNYLHVSNSYGNVRQPGEYVFYAAHLTDYLFTNPYPSIGSSLLSGWNKFNQHTMGELVAFPSLALIVPAILGMFVLVRKKREGYVGFALHKKQLFWLSVLLSGFIFSLGPRLNVNGVFVNIPLPYYLPLKVIPLFEPLRATNRWYLLFLLALTTFAVIGLDRMKQDIWKKVFVIGLSVLFVIEVFPLNLKAERIHGSLSSQLLTETCQATTVLLEYPLNMSQELAKVVDNLEYKTSIMLNSLSHDCLLINGYSGFDPVTTQNFERTLQGLLTNADAETVHSYLLDNQVNLIRLYPRYLSEDDVSQLTNPGLFETIDSTDEYILVRVLETQS